MAKRSGTTETTGVAIIGMAGRFPGANSVAEFWQNLCGGVESIEFASDDELLAAGVPAQLFQKADYVRAGGIVKDADCFDASFFGMNAREAEILDPQQRVFLECCWDAFEDAGYDPLSTSGDVGVFAGVGMNTYSLASLFNNQAILESAGPYQVMLGNDKDFLATRVAYKLNLRGPAIGVQTACSTSLVAVQMAFESLRTGDCDAALAGGVSIAFPQATGYQYVPGMILSPDGHCRAFDSRAAGTVPGRGAAVVLLKRFEQAVADRDHIYAVIRGAAINNDGSFKAGYSAPSIEGQSRVIRKSMEMAGFAPSTVRYVEAHGTGTEVGDPIEVAALSQAFGPVSADQPSCTLGSVKTNIGHLDIAAGATGLIKAALAVRNRLIPPTIHYEKPNPRIPFEKTPFTVNNTLVSYDAPEPFRAGVSSFGIGGTNAHVLIEEIEKQKDQNDSRAQLFVISARTEEAVAARAKSLEQYLENDANADLGAIAWTLQAGRHSFRHRRAFVASSVSQVREILTNANAAQVRVGIADTQKRDSLFLFPGQGSQYLNMGRGLYDAAPEFRDCMDNCSEILLPLIGVDLRKVLYPRAGEETTVERKLEETWLTQPALFAIEYAIAQLWMSCGIVPSAMLGHSVGEYVAACLAGIFSLEDSLRLIALRGKLIFSLPTGAMLAISLPENQVMDLLVPELSIAAINAPSQTVVSGPLESIALLEKKLESRGVAAKRLRTSHAFHSAMLDPIVEQFVGAVSATDRSEPKIPILSNLSGGWLSNEEAKSATYWGRHLREAVRFSDCAAVVAQNQKWIVIEAGPGETLLSFIRRRGEAPSQVRVNSMRQAGSQQGDYETWLAAVGRVWLAGSEVDWAGIHAPHKPFRVPLPGYPFQRQRYWVDPVGAGSVASTIKGPSLGRQPDITDWFYMPSWQKSSPLEPERAAFDPSESVCLLLGNAESQVGRSIVDSMSKSLPVFTVNVSTEFEEHSDRHFSISPDSRDQWEILIRKLLDRGLWPDRIVYTWSLKSGTEARGVSGQSDFFALMALVQAIGSISSSRKVTINLLTSGAFSVAGEPVSDPLAASLSGFARTVVVESPNISCNLVDLGARSDAVLSAVAKEVSGNCGVPIIALRNATRWTQTFEPIRLKEELKAGVKLTRGGTYLITGGQGGLGTVFGEQLARLTEGHIVLTSRKQFPPAENWKNLLENEATSAETKARIEAFERIKAAGGSVHLLQADASDPDRMRQVVDWCRENIGGLHGIIHAAGLPPKSMVFTKTKEHAEQILRPKIQGTMWIEKLLEEKGELDFVLLSSSISAITPGPGDADYATGNAYLDALALKWDDPQGTRVISAAWDKWIEVGMSTDAPETEYFRSIKVREGVEAFERLLACPMPHVVVSTRDVNLLIASIAEQVRNAVANPEPVIAANSSLHPRPEISQPYAEPSDETERGVTEIWSELLGIERVGRFDNFFELGGHSLLGTQMMIRIRQKFGLDLPLRTVFEAPTPAELANLLRAVPWASGYSNAVPMVESEREEIEF